MSLTMNYVNIIVVMNECNLSFLKKDGAIKILLKFAVAFLCAPFPQTYIWVNIINQKSNYDPNIPIHVMTQILSDR